MNEFGNNGSRHGTTLRKLLVYSCCLLAGLWVFNLFYSVIRNVLVSQSLGELILASLLLLATVGVFSFIVLYAWSLFSKLPVVSSVSEADFTPSELVSKIRDEYLRQMPSVEEYARQTGLPADGDLAVALQMMRTRSYPDAESFLKAYGDLQDLQEKRAREIVRKYATFIALKTAVCPWRIVDMVAVFYNSTLMVCEIAAVYNRRTSRAYALKLIFGWTVNMYVSGGIGQVTESAADSLGDTLGEWLGAEGLSGLGLNVASKVAGKAAEGGLNAYLACRLGRQAIQAFRYLQPPPSDLRSILSMQTAEYLAEKFNLKKREVLSCVRNAYLHGEPLSGAASERLLMAELVVRKLPSGKIAYELKLYVRPLQGNPIRAKMAVPYEDDWAFAPQAFRERFIRERTNELLVGLYPRATEKSGGENG